MYNKWHNRDRNNGESDDDFEKSHQIDDKYTFRSSNGCYDDEEMERKRLWLCHYNEPLNEIVEKWNETASYRQKYLEKDSSSDVNAVFEKWPLFKSVHGHLLISIDFKIMYPNVKENLFTQFENFVKKIKPIFEKEIKDPIYASEWKTFCNSECNEGKINIFS